MVIIALVYFFLTPLYMLHPRIARLARAGYLKRERLIAWIVLVMSTLETMLRPITPRYITVPLVIIYSVMGTYIFIRMCAMANKVYQSIMNDEYSE